MVELVDACACRIFCPLLLRFEDVLRGSGSLEAARVS